MERSDEQILPALYKYVGASFSASPSEVLFQRLQHPAMIWCCDGALPASMPRPRRK